VKILIGRDENADVRPKSKLASRRHAELSLKDDRWQIVDLGSANGTFINGRQIRSCKLGNGDIVRFADEEFVFADGELIPRSVAAGSNATIAGMSIISGIPATTRTAPSAAL